MDIFLKPNSTCFTDNVIDPHASNTDTYVQLVISFTLGLSSFFAFCFLRPRWKALYAARKRQIDTAQVLPELPDTFFGWIPKVIQITDEQVLASAGLDAYVFLAFFKMATRFLVIAFILASAIILPINNHFWGYENPLGSGDGKHKKSEGEDTDFFAFPDTWTWSKDKTKNTTWLWTYLVFTYVFTALALYLMTLQTRDVIRVRQDYLGSQSTITDRTIRLSGIPEELRSEEKIVEILEKLEIGKVESVTLCRDWEEIDGLMENRQSILRRLEEFWITHIGSKSAAGESISRPPDQTSRSVESTEEDPDDARDHDGLLGRSVSDHITAVENDRPKTKIWRGLFHSVQVDAIDYFEEKLRRIDEKIHAARKKSYKPLPLAFVTMDSIPACQMAVQALIDPAPRQLLAKLAPAPSDIVWANTYLPRTSRMFRAWIITSAVVALTILWLIPVGVLASLLNLCSIEQVNKRFADFLAAHEVGKAFVQTGLPTLVVSLLNVAVPYLYDFLSNNQGMISQSDVELSVVSKNFFFTFFNVFLVFTIFGAATNIWGTFKKSLSDTTYVAYTLAQSLRSLRLFYANFILLQGVGLFPMRLLEFGSVSLYPFYKWASKTPRDYAELVQPPIFKYGFYLPTALLIFILCIVYSIFPNGFMILLFGLVYFGVGRFVYKYQLLYAMDQPQHATGRAWTMICYRIMVGLGVFQLAMAGVIALQSAFTQAILVIPLIVFTIWFSYFFGQTYEPLTKYIALRSISREGDADTNLLGEDVGNGPARRDSTTLDESREKYQRFVNPSLVTPLKKIWIDPDAPEETQTPELEHQASVESSMSLANTHIWRENGDNV